MDDKTLDRVFKNYDIRGLVNKEITDEFVYATANAFARHFKTKTCLVGRDGRQDSKRLQEAVTRGLLDAGCDVIDIGLTSTRR
jgi:phosphomannomutase